MCDQQCLGRCHRSPFLFFLGMPMHCRETSRLYMQVYTFLEEHESSAPSHLNMPRLNLRQPEADSIFTAGFHRVLWPSLFLKHLLLLHHQPSLSFLLLTPNIGNWFLSALVQSPHYPLASSCLCSDGWGWQAHDKDKADAQEGTLYPPGTCNYIWPGPPTARTAVDTLGERHRLPTKPGLFIFTLLQGSPRAASRLKAVQSAAEGLSLGAAGAVALCHFLLQLCASWQDDGLSPHPNSTCPHPVPSSWSGTKFPHLTSRSGNPNPCAKGQSIGQMAFSHHSAIRHRGGTLKTLSKFQSVIRAEQPLHTTWEHADTVFDMPWMEQILWYQAWVAGKGQVGKVPPLHLFKFLRSSSVTVYPHVSLKVAACLQPEEVSSMGRQPAALPAAGQTFPRSTSMRCSFCSFCSFLFVLGHLNNGSD